MTRWLGSIVFLWHHKITRVVFKGLIPYLAFCLGEGKCKGTVHFFRQHLCHSFLPLYIYPLLQNTHHLSEFTNKAMLVIFIWRLIYELVIPEPKHKFFPNSSQFSPQPADLEVQSFEQIHPFFLHCCVSVFPKSEGVASPVGTQYGGWLSSMLMETLYHSVPHSDLILLFLCVSSMLYWSFIK